MKKVYIKYNPYKLETEITIDGKPLKKNSIIREKSADGNRMQDWIEELPELLKKETVDTKFDVLFHGTESDYDDLVEVMQAANREGVFKFCLEHEDVKGAGDKDKLLAEMFDRIKRGPFEEFRSIEIENAFHQAQSKDFPICVVATMSAGKSTLINAMLGEKLMPSKAGACTAIITQIKNETDEFRAPWVTEVKAKRIIREETRKDKDGKEKTVIITDPKSEKTIKKYANVTLNDMIEINANKLSDLQGMVVSEVRMRGNIPFMSSKDVSLILVDTPGSGNALDSSHEETQKSYLEKNAKPLILFVLPPTFETKGNAELLKTIADSMRVSGKQSKDRFMFVVNKMDNRHKEDDAVEDTLNKIRGILEGYGIMNPNLYPTAALPALSIRMTQNGVKDEEVVDEAGDAVKKLNKKDYHFEKYATLPLSVKKQIDQQLEKQNSIDIDENKVRKMAESVCENDVNDYVKAYIRTMRDGNQALIHSGIVSLESAIRQYAEKYAKTAKIRTVADVLTKKLEGTHYLEKLKSALLTDTKESEDLRAQIIQVQERINGIELAKKYKADVDIAVEKVKVEMKDNAEAVFADVRSRLLNNMMRAVKGDRIEVSKVDAFIEQLNHFIEEIEPEFRERLNEILQSSLVSTANVLITEYKNRLTGLNVGGDSVNRIRFQPIELIEASMPDAEGLVQDLQYTEREKVGEVWVKNTKKKWYKPWMWFQEKGHWEEQFKVVQYVNASEFAQAFFAPIQECMLENNKIAITQSEKQAEQIKRKFNDDFDAINHELERKLSELAKCDARASDVGEKIAENTCKLQWLEQIQDDIDIILDI